MGNDFEELNMILTLEATFWYAFYSHQEDKNNWIDNIIYFYSCFLNFKKNVKKNNRKSDSKNMTYEKEGCSKTRDNLE